MDVDKSILLQKQVRDNSEDLQREFLDLGNWEAQMKRKELELLNERNEQHDVPPVRSKTKKKSVAKEDKIYPECKRLKPDELCDKFVGREICKEKSDKSEMGPLSREELENNHTKALEYKQQGNDFVKQKKWDEAIASYGKAIKIFPYDAIFYANRALCYMKQDNLYAAEADCSSAIQLDNTYMKAYHRRVMARLGLDQYKEAEEDINKILHLEDPCSKETKFLLRQIKKQFGTMVIAETNVCATDISDCDKSNQKVIYAKKDKDERGTDGDNTVKPSTPSVTEPEKDQRIPDWLPEKNVCATDISDREKSNEKVIDAKKDKDDEKGTDGDNTVKPSTPSATEPKKDQRIPDWLPEKDNVAIVEPIEKSPHQRRREPMRKLPVQEADLTKPLKSSKEEVEATCSKIRQVELSDVRPDNITKPKEAIATRKPENFIESPKTMPPVPINSVQFLIKWGKYSSSDFRYRYLKQIPVGRLSEIFQDSMDSYTFSDILMTLKTEFMKRNEPIFSYLKDLSDVKRFRALIMFTSNAEKDDLRHMFSYCNRSEKILAKEVVDLQKKYEL